ncbi:MAG: alpha/beta hydrolase [Euryarchaeota archaeon]|nr:alpha/beta hydrolase [Euryarchaeota archaeon]MDE1835163.1 alpha/beta hydrolase [Euryarchaeota archaeon]MDE1880426.1 alpha/beta hydrolase [Euryarchaeota archaeon]MDE2045705.1 alpha/beta hydrolase [Thermoplasmata archaeon]
MTSENPSRMLSVPGGKLAYEEAGKGVPIVLLHEGIADRRMWDREFAQLATHHRVVRYDLRGFGSSGPSTSEFSHVDDLKALLDHLSLHHPLLVGPSVGGRICLDFVIAHPGVAGGLLLIAPGFSGMDYPMFPPGVFDRDETESKAAAGAWSAGNLEEALGHLRVLWGSALTGKELERFQQMVRENASEVLGETTGQKERPPKVKAASQLSSIRLPVLVLVGDHDNPAMPHVARYLTEHVEGARLRIVPGADHLLNLTAPAAFDAAVEEMVKETAPRGARAGRSAVKRRAPT